MVKRAILSNRVVNFRWDVMDKFKEYDPEGFDKSFVRHQYEILQKVKESGYEQKA